MTELSLEGGIHRHIFRGAVPVNILRVFMDSISLPLVLFWGD